MTDPIDKTTSDIDPTYRVKKLDELRNWFRDLSRIWVAPEEKTAKARRFAFRGQSNSNWGLYSTLFRLFTSTQSKHNKKASEIDERDLLALEKAVMVYVHRRGLHHVEQSRLSFMHQLAYLQHFGGPSRLIDVTFDPNVALWFAAHGSLDEDARVYAFGFEQEISVGNQSKGVRLLTERSPPKGPSRNWENDNKCPWSTTSKDDGWCQDFWIWAPAHLDRRMAAQQGAFLVGGVEKGGITVSTFESNKTTAKTLTTERARALSCLRVNWHVADPEQWKGRGKSAINPNFTLLIEKSVKRDLTKQLEGLYGIRHSRLFPDYAGMASWLLNVAPPSNIDLPQEVWKRYEAELRELGNNGKRSPLTNK